MNEQDKQHYEHVHEEDGKLSCSCGHQLGYGTFKEAAEEMERQVAEGKKPMTGFNRGIVELSDGRWYIFQESASPQDLETKPEIGWVLEKKEDGKTKYIGILDADLFEWTDDPGKAFRLARREDGDNLAKIIGDAEAVREHQWG